MDLTDPDVVAQVYVMQWMHENGLSNALKALERELGRQYDDSQLPEASQLMHLVWRHVEERLQEQADEVGEGADGGGGAAAAASRVRQQQQQEEALRLLRAGADDYAARAVVADVPAEVHRSNVIAVRMVPEQPMVVTAAGDGHVRCIRYATAASGDDAGGSSSNSSGGNSGSGSGPAEVVWETRVGSAALLTLALHPDYSRGLPLVAAGGMDGRVVVLHGPTGAVIAASQPHAKYVVRVAWAPAAASGGPHATNATAEDPEAAVVAGEPAAAAGTAPAATSSQQRGEPQAQLPAQRGEGVPSLLLATASMDETVAILGLSLGLDLDLDPQRAAGDGGQAEGSSGGGDAGGGGGGGGWWWLRYGLDRAPESGVVGRGKLTNIRQVPYGASVADIAFLKHDAGDRGASGPASGGCPAAAACCPRTPSSLVVAVRGSNYLRLLDVARVVEQAAAAAGLAVPERLVNMNESGDDHVSFSPKQLVVSPCGKYLLVCTDTPRLLVLRTADWSVLRVMFGVPVDQFPQPAAAWHHDSIYVYVAGANAQLCVFHLGSGRLVHTSSHHKVNVRDVDYDPARNLLATCSFDKTVKVLARSKQQQLTAAST